MLWITIVIIGNYKKSKFFTVLLFIILIYTILIAKSSVFIRSRLLDLTLWQKCLSVLQEELPAQQFSMWIRPLQCVITDNIMTLYAFKIVSTKFNLIFSLLIEILLFQKVICLKRQMLGLSILLTTS